jgi:hypothetical protein
MNILKQLAVDRAEYESGRRRRYDRTDLHQALVGLYILAREEKHWSREDLVQLVDLAMAEAAAKEAEGRPARSADLLAVSRPF